MKEKVGSQKEKKSKEEQAGTEAKESESRTAKKKQEDEQRKAKEQKSKDEKKKGNKEKSDKKRRRENEKQTEEQSPDEAASDAGKNDEEKKSGDDKKLKAAEGAGLAGVCNSSTHHKEWLRYNRWLKNPKRFPAQLTSKLQSEGGRLTLFKDYLDAKGDAKAILAKHSQTLTESNASQVKYGFRGETWLRNAHGDTKAEKIMKRKQSMGLTIEDPEDPDDVLYFVLVNIDVKNVNELKRITSLEIAGTVDPDLLKAFTEAEPPLTSRKLRRKGFLEHGSASYFLQYIPSALECLTVCLPSL